MSIRQIGQDQRFAQFFRHATTLAGLPGITVTVDVYRMGGGGTPIVADAAATDLGGGAYGYTLAGASAGTADLYFAVFKTADADALEPQLIAGADVGLVWTERLDAAIASRATPANIPSAAVVADETAAVLAAAHGAGSWETADLSGLPSAEAIAAEIGDPLAAQVPGVYPAGSAGDALGRVREGASVQFGPPVLDGAIGTLYLGDDYLGEHGRDIRLSQSGLPDLTGWSLAFKIGGQSVVATCPNAGETSQTLVAELPRSITEALRPGVTSWRFVGTDPDGDIVTLFTGTCLIAL